MINVKSRKFLYGTLAVYLCVWLLFPVNRFHILKMYKNVYVKYIRLTKSSFTSRFKPADLDKAIMHAKSEPWVQKQLANDFAPFAKGISEEQVSKLFKDFQHISENRLVKFIITNNQLSVDAPSELTNTRQYKTIYQVIELLCAQQKIPDCTFIIALNDYLGFIPDKSAPVPIFTFAKHIGIAVEKDTILVPDWMNVRYWDVLRGRIALANKIYPWKTKIEKIHWRGGRADSMLHRAKLVNLTKNLNFLDVGMTEGANAVPYIDPENSVQYKYQIALDGSRCTWERVVWQMSSNTVLIKPSSPQMQWFYLGLEPYKNYVPIRTVDEINITAVYNWLEEHDDKAKEISKSANQFARDNFKTEDFFAYWALALQEYAKLYKSK